MQFKEALKAAGLSNPGRTTWCGRTPDNLVVFTIWEHEIHKLDGRWFAWWSHVGVRNNDGEFSPRKKAKAGAFIALAGQHIGRSCRAVIITPKVAADGSVSVEQAIYPHPLWARVVFRTVDHDAHQFTAELLPNL